MATVLCVRAQVAVLRKSSKSGEKSTYFTSHPVGGASQKSQHKEIQKSHTGQKIDNAE